MEMKQKIFTIPNLLSLLRLLLIPVILRLYWQQRFSAAEWVLILSAVTDVVDGWIARRWNLISDLGKALDPVADKLTLIAAAWCLVSRFPHLWWMLGMLVIKEAVSGAMSLYAVKKSGVVKGADWHGKVCTALLYSTIGLHMLCSGIPMALSKCLMVLCMGMMLLSGVLYWYRNWKQIRGWVR